MKRLFKFFTVAAIIAAGFTGCSSETEVVPPGPDGTDPLTEVGGEATYASFKISGLAGAATKSVDDASGEVTPVSITEFRVLIFRADNSLEVDTARAVTTDPDSLLTIPLISGSKRIFVLVNGGQTSGALGIPAKGAFPAGTAAYAALNPKHDLSTDPAAGPITGVQNMGTLYGTKGSKFIYSNGVLNATQALQPGVGANESKDPATANGNFIDITVDRLVAKAAITKKVPSGPDSNPDPVGKIITKDSAGNIDVNNVKYRYWNVNRHVFPFQNVDASNNLFTANGDLLAPPTDFTNTPLYARGQGAGTTNTYLSVATRTGTPGASSFFYLTENVPANKYGGNTTYAEVEAIFLPTKGYYLSNEINYNESNGQFIPQPTSELTTDITTATDLYQFIGEGYNGLPVYTVFASATAGRAKALAQKVVYHIGHPTTPPQAVGSSLYNGVTDAEIATYFTLFGGGKAYYRLNLGEEVNGSVEFGIKRNYYYDAQITGFLKLGENTPEKLLDPNVILEGKTNITVHIIIRDWTGKVINVDI